MGASELTYSQASSLWLYCCQLLSKACDWRREDEDWTVVNYIANEAQLSLHSAQLALDLTDPRFKILLVLAKKEARKPVHQKSRRELHRLTIPLNTAQLCLVFFAPRSRHGSGMPALAHRCFTFVVALKWPHDLPRSSYH